MTLMIIKIIVTISIVLGLSVIAERVSPRWAGLLGGYPLSVSIVLIFLAIEQGPEFGAQSAIHTLAGLIANLSLFGAYGVILSLRPQTHWLLCGLGSLSVFLGAGLILGQIHFTVGMAALAAIFYVIFCVLTFRRFVEMKIEKAVRLSFSVVFVRATAACFVVLAITGTARLLGPEMAGVLASFPATVFPMIVIVHLTYGAAPVLAVLKHFPVGMGATVVFTIFFSSYVERLDVLWGTLGAFGLATIYLLGFSFVQEKMRRHKAGAL